MIYHLSDSRKTTEITSHNTIFSKMCVFVRLFVYLFPYFSEVFPPPPQLEKQCNFSSEESIFLILMKGIHY